MKQAKQKVLKLARRLRKARERVDRLETRVLQERVAQMAERVFRMANVVRFCVTVRNAAGQELGQDVLDFQTGFQR